MKPKWEIIQENKHTNNSSKEIWVKLVRIKI